MRNVFKVKGWQVFAVGMCTALAAFALGIATTCVAFRQMQEAGEITISINGR